MKRVPNPAMVHVACAPSKFPYGGLSPGRLQATVSFGSTISFPATRLGSSPRSAYPHPSAGVIRSSSPGILCAPSTGMISQSASGPTSDHRGPRVLGSGRVLLSLPSQLLQPDPSVSMAPMACPGALVIPWVCARRPGLGYPRDLPCCGSALLPDVPPSLRREEEQRHPPVCAPAPNGFPPQKPCVSSSTAPDTSFCRGFADDAAMFTSWDGPRGCSPSWTDPTWRGFVADGLWIADVVPCTSPGAADD